MGNEKDLNVPELHERNIECCVVNIVEILERLRFGSRRKVFSVGAFCSSLVLHHLVYDSGCSVVIGRVEGARKTVKVKTCC